MCFSVPGPSVLSISDLGCDLGGRYALAPAASLGHESLSSMVPIPEEFWVTLNPPLGVPMFPSLRPQCCPSLSPEPHLFIPQVSSSVSTSHFSAWTLVAAEQNLCLSPVICTRGSNDPDTSGRVGEGGREGRQGTPGPLIKLDILGKPSSFHSFPECLGSHGASRDRK